MPCICGLFLCLFIRAFSGSSAGLILPVSGHPELSGSSAGLILPVSGTRSFPGLPPVLSFLYPAPGAFPDLPPALFYLYLAISEIACMFSNAMGIFSSP